MRTGSHVVGCDCISIFVILILSRSFKLTATASQLFELGDWLFLLENNLIIQLPVCEEGGAGLKFVWGLSPRGRTSG